MSVSAPQPYQRRTCSGLVQASNTRSRGASKTRRMAISRSDGSVREKVGSLLASTLALLLRLCLHLEEIVLEPIEAVLPQAAVVLEPVVRVPERAWLEAARAPLCGAPARDETGALQHLEMLGDGGEADVEGLRQLRHRRLPQRQPRQDRPPGRVGQRRKRRGEAVRRHGCYVPVG